MTRVDAPEKRAETDLSGPCSWAWDILGLIRLIQE